MKYYLKRGTTCMCFIFEKSGQNFWNILFLNFVVNALEKMPFQSCTAIGLTFSLMCSESQARCLERACLTEFRLLIQCTSMSYILTKIEISTAPQYLFEVKYYKFRPTSASETFFERILPKISDQLLFEESLLESILPKISDELMAIE